MKVTLSSIATALFLYSAVMSTSVPNTVNYQGRLTDSAGVPVPDGAILVKFQIYDAATGGTVLWNSQFQTINTVNGLFSYDLGSNIALPDLFGTDSVRFLGITIGTNPENSPRSRFTSSGYVFKSQKSDLALNADSLGSLQPSYYLDWNNQTNVPAGFADGVDDVGMDQATADNRYINFPQDRLEFFLDLQKPDGSPGIRLWPEFGQLQTFDADGLASTRLSDLDGGELDLWDGSSAKHITARLKTSINSGGQLMLADSSGANKIQLLGGRTGDVSVTFPVGAINSSEILNEPGIASNASSNTVNLLVPAMTDIITVTITLPTDGYVKIDAQCRAQYRGTTARNFGWFQIDETAGGSLTPPYFVGGGADGFASAGLNDRSIYVTRVFFKSAGSYTFRLEGTLWEGSAVNGFISVTNAIITATYFPTSYGSVTTIAGQPGDHPHAKAVSLTDPNGTVTTGYEMDLRYYEEKARAARIAKQKADLAEATAELELARARQNGIDK